MTVVADRPAVAGGHRARPAAAARHRGQQVDPPPPAAPGRGARRTACRRPGEGPGERRERWLRLVLTVGPRVSRCGAAARRGAGRRRGCRRSACGPPRSRGGRRRPRRWPRRRPRPGRHRRISNARSASSAGDEGDQPALVGDVERVEAEEAAGGAHVVGHRDVALADLDADPGRAGDLVQRWRPARRGSGRAARGPRRPRRAATATTPLRGAVSERMSEPNSSPSRTLITAMPCRPIGPLTSTTSPGRAWSGPISHPVGHQPDPGGGDVQPVAVPGVDHLGVAGDDLHPGGARGGRHRRRPRGRARPSAGPPRG